MVISLKRKWKMKKLSLSTPSSCKYKLYVLWYIDVATSIYSTCQTWPILSYSRESRSNFQLYWRVTTTRRLLSMNEGRSYYQQLCFASSQKSRYLLANMTRRAKKRMEESSSKQIFSSRASNKKPEIRGSHYIIESNLSFHLLQREWMEFPLFRKLYKRLLFPCYRRSFCMTFIIEIHFSFFMWQLQVFFNHW